MWKNKNFFIGLALLSCFVISSVEGASASPSKREVQKQIRILMQKDPREPDLNPVTVNNIFNLFQEKFIKYEWPATLEEVASSKYVPTPAYLRALANRYKKLLSNPEIEEAMEYSTEWFNAVGAQFIKFYRPLEILKTAQWNNDKAMYQAVVLEYKKQAALLDKLLKNPEKISAKKLSEMKDKNTKIRRSNQRKQLQSLEKKLRSLQ